MTDLDKLIEAVEGGAIGVICWREFSAIGSGFGVYVDHRAHDAMRAYTGSLDAAKALHDALLPEYFFNVNSNYAVVGCYPKEVIPLGGNPARAWLIAVLKAYRAQVQG